MIRCRTEVLREVIPWDGLEDAWWLIGEVIDSEIIVNEVVRCGEDRTSTSVRIVPPDYIEKVVGLLHTHPITDHEPSEADLRADQVLVSLFQGGVGLFGILSDELRWFLLRTSDSHYTPIKVTEF